jgi:hypothetical protein
LAFRSLKTALQHPEGVNMKTVLRVGGAAGLLIAVVAGFLTMRANAQDEAVPLSSHPAIGTWRISAADSTGRVQLSGIITLHADGTAIELDGDGTWWLGVWAATGQRTFEYRLESANPDGSGMGFNDAVEIAADGQSWLPPAGTVLAPGEGVVRITVDSMRPAPSAQASPVS